MSATSYSALLGITIGSVSPHWHLLLVAGLGFHPEMSRQNSSPLDTGQ